MLALANHPEFRKGAVHTNFIPNYYCELFREKKWSEDAIIFSVCGQIFSEYISNCKNIGNKDPFVSEGNFRINHLLTKQLNYKLDGTAHLNVDVTFLTKYHLNIKYILEEKEKGKIENEFTAEGSYFEESDSLNIECRFKDRVNMGK